MHSLETIKKLNEQKKPQPKPESKKPAEAPKT